jgi:hypothetical protein
MIRNTTPVPGPTNFTKDLLVITPEGAVCPWCGDEPACCACDRQALADAALEEYRKAPVVDFTGRRGRRTRKASR